MDKYAEILRALGRIEGELVEIRKLSERVSRLESLLAWLKGGSAEVWRNKRWSISISGLENREGLVKRVVYWRFMFPSR